MTTDTEYDPDTEFDQDSIESIRAELIATVTSDGLLDDSRPMRARNAARVAWLASRLAWLESSEEHFDQLRAKYGISTS